MDIERLEIDGAASHAEGLEGLLELNRLKRHFAGRSLLNIRT